ncbi:MAG: matrixin family metalloprotease [Candidatus Delongbacteria bacterium]|nr:matrixin family metalloprotease [Candidatus Delongbacteria bacterium]
MDSWLATPGDHTVYLTSEVDNLKTTWGLDLNACIQEVNSHGVTNAPTLIAASTTSETELCIVKYETVYLDTALSIVDTSSVAICNRTGPGEYFNFTIIVNDTVFNPSTHQINIVMMHELTHSLGLDDVNDASALMHGYTNTTATGLTNDEKNGIKNVYELPVIKNVTSNHYQYYVTSGDSIILAYEDTLIIDMKGPDFLVHNSIKPPSVRTESFMNSLNPTDTLEYTVIDSNLYRYIIPADDLETESVNLFRSFLKRNSMNHDLSNYFSENSPLSKLYIDVKPIPEVIYPNPDDIYPIKPPGKAIVTDTLEIKVQVPQVLGSYPEINIKIDGVYVNQADIVLEDSLWVYPWDLSTVTSDPDGKRFKIEAELLDDPNCGSISSVFTVEAVFLEHFQEITDLQTEGWTISSYEWPLQTYTGWMLGPDPTYIAGEKCARTYSTYSTSFSYQLWTPAFTVPDSSLHKTKLEYKLYYKKLNSPNSYIYFDVCDASGTPLTTTQMLGPMYGTWTNMNYDLSDYSNQTIKLRWNHNYTNGIDYCWSTSYALDNVVVYGIPDMDYPSIDFVFGNQANVNEDMQIQLTFNDVSDIESVTADYGIEGDSGTITLTSGKNTYNYTGVISARDHECDGDIIFRIKDIIGNEIISDTYDIYWTDVTQILTAPDNVLMTMENDTTVTLSWEMVPGASEYEVYTSEDPYGAFTIDSTGTFITSTQWQKNSSTNKKFYYIIAASTSKTKDKVEIKKNIEAKDKK